MKSNGQGLRPTERQTYLSTVRPKKNHAWTEDEMFKIFEYRLRRKYTSDEIAYIMGLKKTQVQNCISTMRQNIKGRCRNCGHELTQKELRHNKGSVYLTCDACRESISDYKKELRIQALSKGLCGSCHINPLEPGHTTCTPCKSDTYRRRNKIGLCGFCGERPVRSPDASLCEVCTKNMRIAKHNRR